MKAVKYIAIILCFLSFLDLKAVDEDFFPYKLTELSKLEGIPYKIDDSTFITVKNNWLDNTAIISVNKPGEPKKTTILDNTEFIDFQRKENKNYSLIVSRNRLFITKLNDDFSVDEIFLIDTTAVRSDEISLLDVSGDTVILNKNNSLFSFNIKSKVKQRITNRYVLNSYLRVSKEKFLYLRQSNELVRLVENREYKYEKEILRFEISERYDLVKKNGKLLVLQYYSNNIHIIILDDKYNIINDKWIDSERNLSLININDEGELEFYTLSFEESRYSLIKSNFQNEIKEKYNFPESTISVIDIILSNDEITVLFNNGVFGFDSDLNPKYYKPLNLTFNGGQDRLKLLNLSNMRVFSAGETYSYYLQDNPFHTVYKFTDELINLIIPLFLTFLSIALFLLYKRQKKLYESLLQLSDNDFIFVFDKKGNLLNANEKAMEIIEIDADVPLGRYFQYYCISEHTNELLALFEKMRKLNENFKQKIHIFKDDNLKEYICNVITKRSVTGSVNGYIINGIDITEELIQQKLNNFAQLAHDMQTNLTTIRLNAEELNSYNEYDENKRLKIIKQINILIQKVRDIVTIGRSTSVNKSVQNTYQIFNELFSEFDPEVYPNINFKNEVEDFTLNCDKQKLIRAFRNAAENSIKAVKDREEAIITYRAYKNSKFAYFEIEDNGIGMRDEVKKNMLKPYFSEGEGTGLGTMIMKNAIEQHGGEIDIESEINKGTKVKFKIPLK